MLPWHPQRCAQCWHTASGSLGQAPLQLLNPLITFNLQDPSRRWGLPPPYTDEDSETQGEGNFPRDTQLTRNTLGSAPRTSYNNLCTQVQSENVGPLVQISRQRQTHIKPDPSELGALSDCTGYEPLKPAPWAPMCSDSRPKARLLPLRGP